jgi:hypothetical protein
MTADRSFAASNKEFADVNKEGFFDIAGRSCEGRCHNISEQGRFS